MVEKFIKLAVLLALLMGSVACDRNIAPFVPGEQPSQPDLSRIFPAPEEETAPAPGAMASRSPVASTSGRSGAAVRGRVSLAPGLSQRSGTLFIIARRQGVAGGPPLAVLRVPSPSFPLAFEIGPDQVMMPGTAFEGPMSLSARLDSDGDAMTRGPDDPATRGPLAVAPGMAGVELQLGSASATRSPAASAPSGGRGEASVRGIIELAAPGKSSEGTLFVIARRLGVSGGPPVAVLRISRPSFPLAFEIGPDQVMMPGVRFEGSLGLTARLDADGDAMTRDARDPATTAPVTVSPGAEGIGLRLE
jgi:hypothetical protein